MCDEDVAEAELLLQAIEKINHLSLDRDVQRRDRLVEQKHLWVQSKGPRYTDALTLAPGELMRKAVAVLGVQPDRREQLLDSLPALVPVVAAVHPQRLSDDLSDRHAGVEGGIGILKHELDLPPELAHLAARDRCDVLALEGDPALGRVEQARDRPGHGGLAAPGLAHYA